VRDEPHPGALIPLRGEGLSQRPVENAGNYFDYASAAQTASNTDMGRGRWLGSAELLGQYTDLAKAQAEHTIAEEVEHRIARSAETGSGRSHVW
jgi:hypothetical protein